MKNSRTIVAFLLLVAVAVLCCVVACSTSPEFVPVQSDAIDGSPRELTFEERDLLDAIDDARDLAECLQRGIIPEGYRP